jgi:hypothetical protein
VTSGRWTKEQLKLAFHLYCQLPFGRLHSRNPEIIQLATLIGRTPSAVAMKLVNFASLDPAIVNSGRSGLGNASALDKEVWEEFHADWEKLAVECEQLRHSLERDYTPETTADAVDDGLVLEDFVDSGCNSDQWITSGIHYVNRICYLVTEKPHNGLMVDFLAPYNLRSLTPLTPLGLKRQLRKLEKAMAQLDCS